VIGLSSRARWQVRKLLAVLTRMRKDLPPSARIEAVRRLGWCLGPGLEASRVSAEDSGLEPTRAPKDGNQIRKFLEEWQRKYKESEERNRAERDEAFRSDDESAQDEERLAAERTAELEKRTKVVEQRLPVVTAGLSILWNEVTGSSRPAPSEIQLASTGTEMTAEEHVATAETHLRYAEGHLQPTEEHLRQQLCHHPSQWAMRRARTRSGRPLSRGTGIQLRGPEQARGAGERIQRQGAPPGSGGVLGVSCQQVPGFGGSPPG
jgi:hypothetical protein